IQVVGQPMSGVESVAIGIVLGAGARDEENTKSGLSHFTEQMLFRGTDHLSARELSDRFDRLGIDYDSSAGVEMTLLSAVLVGNRLAEAIDLLADVVRFASFPEDAMDNVRALITQEIRQREDKPGQKVMDLLRQKFFAGSPLARDVLGSEESIGSIQRSDLVAYWRDRYTANNIVISVAGNFVWEPVLAQLRTITAGWPQGSGRMIMDQPATNSGFSAGHRESSQENIGFAFPGVRAGDKYFYAAGLLSQAFGGGSNSRLFREVREKRGLAYAVGSRFDGLEKAGIFRILVGTSGDRAHESVAVIMDELRKIEQEGITEEELRLSKTRLKSQMVMRSESTSARMAANLRSWWFEQRVYGLREVSDLIDSVTLGEIRSLIEGLGITKNLAAVAVGPRSEEELFGAILTRS
ncbi:MAG: M16 family metallopeptidase, partial [Chloroflexota bacterium]